MNERAKITYVYPPEFKSEEIPYHIGIIVPKEELEQMEKDFQLLNPEFQDSVEEEIEQLGEKIQSTKKMIANTKQEE